MAHDILIKTSVDEPYQISDKEEKSIKVCLEIEPSEDVRGVFEEVDAKNVSKEVCILMSYNTFIQQENSTEKTVNELLIQMESIKRIINLASENEKLTLVINGSTPRTIFKSVSGSEKEYMLDQLKNLPNQANGKIITSFKEVKGILEASESRIKKVVFLAGTIEGEEDIDALLFEVSKLVTIGVSVDCFGVGNNIKFSLLEKISSVGNGRTNIIKDKDRANTLLKGIWDSFEDVIVTEAKIKLGKISKSVRITECYKGTPEKRYLGKAIINEDREMIINLGQVEKEQRYTYYFLVNIPPSDYIGPMLLMTVDVEYSIPRLYGEKKFNVSNRVIIEFGNDEEKVKVNGKVNSGFYQAEIKRYEDEIEEAQNKKDFYTVVDRFIKIIDKCTKLGNVELVRQYTKLLDNYHRCGDVDINKLSKARNATSKAGDEGLMKTALSEEEISNIFTQKRKQGIRRRRR